MNTNTALMHTNRRSKIKLSKEDRLFYIISGIFIFLILIVLLYPMIFIFSASFSSPQAVNSGRVILWPVDVTFQGYEYVFRNDDILLGYRNSLFYAGFGTAINLFMTMIAAYPLATKEMPFRRSLMLLFSFTMFFSGGLIPSYLLIVQLGIINTPWAMVLPGAISVYNLIITRTFIQNSIPGDITDAAKIDGASEYRYFISILLPLSKAVIAVITLYYMVAHWNSYFNAFLYLRDERLFPLQIFLRNILVLNDVQEFAMDPETMQFQQDLADQLKYGLIVVSSLPVIVLYMFVKRFFVHGVMIGSIKG